jgi:hypothetical protein
MALPELNSGGELPEGVHGATMEDIIGRFGSGTPQRRAVTARMLRIYDLAQASGGLDRFVIFGSYVTDKPDPNDVDIVLVMRDDFDVVACAEEIRRLFDHQQAASAYGASIFWTRPRHLIIETIDEFVAHWQIKRDQTRRGIVEAIP